MALIPANASWHERLEELILSLRGRGVTLSADDLEHIEQWERHQAPLEVVARGLQSAAESQLWTLAPGDSPLRSLKSAHKHVSRELQKYSARHTSLVDNSHPKNSPNTGTLKTELGPMHLERHQRLIKTVQSWIREAPSTFPKVTFASEFVLPLPGSLVDCETNELRVHIRVLRLLPAPMRWNIFRNARTATQKANILSHSSRKQSLRFHYKAIVRKELNIPIFW